jgi:hypothetical protein
MLAEFLPRSQAALKRHRKRLSSHLDTLRANPELVGRTDLELVLLALGDPTTQRTLMAHWRNGGDHPIAAMAEDDVRNLDRDIAQAIVLAATCDPMVQDRQRPADSAPPR